MYCAQSSFGFVHKMSLVVLSCLNNFIRNSFVRMYCDSCHVGMHLKKTSKLVNICIAILILNMKEMHDIFGILRSIISRKVKMQLKCRKKDLCSVWRRCSDQMCQRWFVKFHAKDFCLDNAPWLGRPVEVDRDQIKTLIENNQCYTTQVYPAYSKYPNQ